MTNAGISASMTVKLELDPLPPDPVFETGIRRAPRREAALTPAQEELALRNALRYVPEPWHAKLAPEFLAELRERGRVYGYRFRPAGALRGRPVDEYAGLCLAGKALQVMIDNNLDFQVALYPYELVTYGETGQVCQNWMQYRLIKRYLEILTEDQTLVVESGHPLGLFRSHPLAPRVIVTNGLMIGHVRQLQGLRRGGRPGSRELRPDDRGRLDVHRPPGHSPRYLQHPAQRRPSQAGRTPGRGPCGKALHLLGPGRDERSPGQGGRHSRSCEHHRGGGPQPHRDSALPGLGGLRGGDLRGRLPRGPWRRGTRASRSP